MQIMDASGNFLKLLGAAGLYIKTQVLVCNTIKKLEVAVQKQGVSEEREILLSLKTLVDWNIVHPEFPNIKLDDYIEKERKHTLQFIHKRLVRTQHRKLG